MKRRDFVRHLLRHGCELVREGRRHTVYRNPVNGRSATVPRHTEVDDYTARGICRQLGIPEL